MTSRLFLTGIRASGRHGADPGEKDQPQDFVVDLDVEIATVEDSIDSTADYRRIVGKVREVVAAESFDLVETLAQAVASSVAHVDRVVGVRVVVHKPAAAASLGIQGVSAAATAEP